MDLEHASQRIKDGGIVAFPTETVYGLGANAFDEKAVRKIFRAKGRPSDNPCIVHVSDERMLLRVVSHVPREAKRLMKKFWPGPLTLIFTKHSRVPENVTGGLPTVAVRMPTHPIALALIKKTGPIAAPSANKSGRPSPTTAAHVKQDFPSILVLDGGPCQHGVESTVVSLAGAPTVLRLGAITFEELRSVVPNIAIAKHTTARPMSPGMKYRHYAPNKPLILFRPTKLREMQRYARKHADAVVLCKNQHSDAFPKNSVISLGTTSAEVAANLFNALRTRRGKRILVLGLKKQGHGRAVMDRLERAAREII